jgi:hypothetical protein
LLWTEHRLVASEAEGKWWRFEVDAEKSLAAAEGAGSDGADEGGREATVSEIARIEGVEQVLEA